MRCLALAQAWQGARGRVAFAIAEAPTTLNQRLASEGFEIASIPQTPGGIEDAKATVRIARHLRSSWLVVDGDRFDVAFLEYLRSSRTRTLLIDDFAERESFPVDLILNLNLGASEALYRKQGAEAELLLGESYALLRREFTSWRETRNFPEKGNRILVTLGGSDPENLTPKVAESLARKPDYKIKIITGPAYDHPGELLKFGFSNVRVEFNSSNMSTNMAEADLAIVVAGGTLWELLYMGCAVLSYSRNSVQAQIVEDLERKGAVRNLGAVNDFDGSRLAEVVEEVVRSKTLRRQMATAGRQIIDGEGAARVVQHLRGHG
jgi:UDP-2,4-diacetamido-2,4,6-trideoxy-beta-L-altropyranose hydrolase